MTARRIAFVVQRYGPEVSGGAETLCRQLAEHLSRYVDIDVLTTCAVEYERWANYYPAGRTQLNRVPVHRFVVDEPRDPRRFDEITLRVLNTAADLDTQLEWMRQQGPISSGLLRYIATHSKDYRAFVFFTYLYGTTFLGLPLVWDKALLIPAAHDEPTFYLDIFQSVFHLPRAIIYNTESERRLTQRLFSNERIPCAVIGTGIDVPADVRGDRFRARYGLRGDFVIYVGRVDESKNVRELFDHFLAFRARDSRQVKLVVIGKGSTPIPRHPDIVPLGFVSEQDKFDGLQAAAALILPSKYESLSIVVLEAWRVGTPVLVNGDCEVMKDQCRLGQGGLWYQSSEEFGVVLRALLDQPGLRRRLAESGRAFAETTYAWDRVERSYLDILDRFDGRRA